MFESFNLNKARRVVLHWWKKGKELHIYLLWVQYKRGKMKKVRNWKSFHNENNPTHIISLKSVGNFPLVAFRTVAGPGIPLLVILCFWQNNPTLTLMVGCRFTLNVHCDSTRQSQDNTPLKSHTSAIFLFLLYFAAIRHRPMPEVLHHIQSQPQSFWPDGLCHSKARRLHPRGDDCAVGLHIWRSAGHP